MRSSVYGVFLSALWLFSWDGNLPDCIGTNTAVWPRALTHPLNPASYGKSLRFNVYSFTVSAADSGAVRDLTVTARRGSLLLTTFRVRVDGAVADAEVADLDNNRFPELYVYSISNGSGSFGRVYAWQFMPERKADIRLVDWSQTADNGYMGHDNLWLERGVLCRSYPVFRPGDGNSGPTGGTRLVRYQLKPAGAQFALVAQPK